MSAPTVFDPESVLQWCAARSPSPLYPSEVGPERTEPRETLDRVLNDLRLAGLVEMTDWVRERGQGYRLTLLGREALDNPRILHRALRTMAGRMATGPRHGLQAEDLADGTTYAHHEAVRQALLQIRSPLVTRGLLILNIGVFLVGMLLAVQEQVPLNRYVGRGDPSILRKIGALNGLDLISGNWWRLVTCCFVHIGLLHLAVNMYALYVLGPLSEQVWGRGRFLLIYALSGLGGAVTAILWKPFSGLAGASGALWGIQLALIGWVYLNRSALPPGLIQNLMQPLIQVLLLNVLISLAVPTISASAHFGGGAIGFLLAVLLNAQQFSRPRQRKMAWGGLLALPLLLVGTTWQVMQIDPRWDEFRQVERGLERIRRLHALGEEIVLPLEEVRMQLRKQDAQWLRWFASDPAKDPATVETARQQIASVRQQLAAVGLKLREWSQRVADDEGLLSIVAAGEIYLQATEAFLKQADEQLALPIPQRNEAERGQRHREMVAAREQWIRVVTQQLQQTRPQ